MRPGPNGYQFGIRFAGDDPVVQALLEKEAGQIGTVLGSIGLIGLSDTALGEEQGGAEVPWNVVAGAMPVVGAMGGAALQASRDPVVRVALDQSIRGPEKAASAAYRADPKFANQYEKAVQELGDEVLARMVSEYEHPDIASPKGRAAHDIYVRHVFNPDRGQGPREYAAPRLEHEMKLAAMRRAARPALSGALFGSIPAVVMMGADWFGGGQKQQQQQQPVVVVRE